MIRKFLFLVLCVFVGLALLPIAIQAAGVGISDAITSATTTLEGLAPKLAALSLAVAVAAASIAGIFMAFGHKHGHRMLRGSALAAFLALGSGAFWAWLSRQGPQVGNVLMAHGSTWFNQFISRIP